MAAVRGAIARVGRSLGRPLSTVAPGLRQVPTLAHVRYATTTARGDLPDVQPDYYGVLGISRTATIEEVKAAFREQAKLHHPDVRAADADIDTFKLINEAYSVLSDQVLRREYDASGDVKFNRVAALKRRNEGLVGADGQHAATDHMTPEERFRRSMERATERQKDSARFRATMARLNRARVRCVLPSLESV